MRLLAVAAAPVAAAALRKDRRVNWVTCAPSTCWWRTELHRPGRTGFVS
jgi:hypothetical protein